jgi:arylsulfatase A-like enzyme
VSTPAIARLPRQFNPQSPITQIATVRDVAPALMAVAGAPDPGDSFQGRNVNPITGASLLSMLRLRTPQTHFDDQVLGWGPEGHHDICEGVYKLVCLPLRSTTAS